MTLGGRYDFAKTSALTRTTGTTAEINDQAFTWRGGINYLFDNGITSAIANRSNRFRVPLRRQTVRSCRGKQYEAGVKYVPKDLPLWSRRRSIS
jgi:iron complex outermembrane receptor protein